ncbi:glucose dehydrogenase [FAD, quinone]-like [Chrysoperla carnea]|uniref:glucose dehydrogenase [FAD, quinone]-like n=1 Tax=Chrysoperla carnea TaxID=189513 RepID=UPI001D08A1E4|nr:glucose dehydrogenase [FAD, quinone]-like [Chrysoperla carnea]
MHYKTPIFIIVSVLLITTIPESAAQQQGLFLRTILDTIRNMNLETMIKFMSAPFLRSFMKFAQEGERELNEEPPDEPFLLPEYDFIIVGAGTAGCALANRLTENPAWTVLLIEAGRQENYMMDIPIMANYWQLIETDWKYKTQPDKKACLGHTNGQCNWPRGKVMGGSSVLNYMIYTRGNRRDYDGWAQLGNDGWSYEEVLPYFKKLEDFTVNEQFDPRYHNRGGPLSVGYSPYHTKIAEAFVEAAQTLGYPYVDYDGPTQVGVSYLHTSIQNGTRHSSSRAYLHDKRRSNLHVAKLTQVTKIIIDENNRARGVSMLRGNIAKRALARREVIVSAGAINSPQLLMLSGIGPRKHLESLGIPVRSDLKVGHNLQDHWALGGLTFLINQSVSLVTERIVSNADYLQQYFEDHSGPLSVAGGCEALIFDDLKRPGDPDGHPNLEILVQGGSIISNPLLRKDFGISDYIYNSVYKPIEKFDSWMAFPMIMLPKSRGRIMLANKNPLSKPLIYPNYYGDLEDLEVTVEGAKKIIALSKTPAFQKYGSRINPIPLPPCKHLKFLSDDYLRCHARQLTFTIYHHVGTCKMGPDSDPDAVVNSRLQVRGIQGLRVIDASIMPVIPAAHTNSPTYMIAEKGADLIKKHWGFIQ